MAWGLKSIAKSTVNFNRAVENFVGKVRGSWGKARERLEVQGLYTSV